jgi:hypothetical protein
MDRHHLSTALELQRLSFERAGQPAFPRLRALVARLRRR